MPDKTMSNLFIDRLNDIYIPEKHTIRNHIKAYKSRERYDAFIDTIMHGSPDLNLLWQFADFIKLSERIYGYDNSSKNKVFSSYKYSEGENGFKLTTETCTIVIKLFEKDNAVGIDIENTHGSKLKSNFYFEDMSWTTNPTVYDELQLDHIIDIVNQSMVSMFNEVIKLRFGFRYEEIEHVTYL
jgi:hypothetical protein